MHENENATVMPDDAARQPETLWEYADVANYLRVHESTVRRRVAEASIPFRRIGGRVLFIPDEIRRWVSEQPAA